MKRKTTHTTLLSALLRLLCLSAACLWGAVPTACTSAADGLALPDDDGAEPTVSLFTRTGTDADNDAAAAAGSSALLGDAYRPVFIFWRASDYNNGKLSDPFLVAHPSGAIDDYREEMYDTGHNYPPNNLIVVASGYSPANALSFSRSDYATLLVAPDQMGKADIMVARQVVTASALHPFHREERLEFIHAQTLLEFDACTVDDVSKLFKNVRVSVERTELAQELKWTLGAADEEGIKAGRYAVTETSSSTEASVETGPGESVELLPRKMDNANRAVGSLYIKPEKSEVHITVTAQMADGADYGFASPTDVSATLTVHFVDSDGITPLTLKAGDKYKITLLFEEDQIEITGRRVDWQEGGQLVIPVYPIEDEGEEEEDGDEEENP